MRRSLSLFATCLLLGLGAAEGVVPAAVVAAGKVHLATIVAARNAAITRLNERLAKDAASGDMVDLQLQAEEMRNHTPLVFEVFVRGGRCYGGPARLTSFNHGEHETDASGLTCTDGRLSGTMKVTLNPDQWVPTDHLPRYQEHVIDAVVADGKVNGTYRFTGELGPDKDALTGIVVPVPASVAVTAPTGTEDFAVDTAGLVALAQTATKAYRQLRAAAVADLRYPLSFARAEEENRVCMPFWKTDGDVQALGGEIAAYVAGLAGIATAFDPTVTPEVAAGFCHPEDDRFGPFFQNTPLPVTAGLAALPADTGSAGPQRWQYLNDWEVIGPFPAPHRRDVIHPQLPEMLPSSGARYLLKTADMPDDHFVHRDWLSEGDLRNVYNSYQAANWFKTFKRPETAELHAVPCQVQTGRWEDSLIPPRWACIATKVPVWGCTKCSYFAFARLQVPRDLEIWCEASPLDAGQFWVNGRLVWYSLKDVQDIKRPKVTVFKVALKTGINELVFRVRNDDPQTHFRLLFCTRGRPASATEVASRAAAGGTDPTVMHSNFRGNGTGSFPAPATGTPPLVWDLAQGINVKWKVDMPSYSNAYPLIVGDRIFTNNEPHTLYCFDKHTGAELWHVDSSIAEFLPEDQRAPVEAAFKKLGSIYRSEEQVDAALEKLQGQREEIELKLLREGEKLDEKTKAELQEQSAALAKQIDDQTGQSSPGDRILRDIGAGIGGWFHFTGHSMPTPVTDGKHIWVKYATGIVACYDLDGQRQWITDTLLTGPIPCVSSPVQVGDRIIVEGGWQKRAKSKGMSKEDVQAAADAHIGEDLHFLVGLDATTGAVIWDAAVKGGSGGYGTPGGPRAMRLLLPGEGHLDIVITQRNIFRASDGMELHRATGTNPGYTGYVIGNQLFSGGQVTSFWAESEEQIGVRHVLQGKAGGNSALTSNGLLVGNPDPGISAGRTHIAMMDLAVADARSGDQVYRVHPLLGETGPTYVPAAACGEYAYLTDGRCGGNPLSSDPAIVVVVKAGNPSVILARSKLDGPTYTAPIFDDGRAYIRTRRSLICLESTPAGEALLFERGIDELFSVHSRLPLPPEGAILAAIAPMADFVPSAGVPVNKIYERLGPPEWLVAGPAARGGTDPLAAVGGPGGARPGPGVACGTLTFQPLDPQHVDAQRGTQEDLFSRKHFTSTVNLDLSGISGGAEGVFYFYTVLEVTHPKSMRYLNKFSKVRTWLAGQEIANEQAFDLTIGYYPLMISVELAKLPSFLAKQKLLMSPLFKELPATEDALAAWRQRVRPYRERLQAVVDKTDGRWVVPAKMYLQKLGAE